MSATYVGRVGRGKEEAEWEWMLVMALLDGASRSWAFGGDEGNEYVLT